MTGLEIIPIINGSLLTLGLTLLFTDWSSSILGERNNMKIRTVSISLNIFDLDDAYDFALYLLSFSVVYFPGYFFLVI